MSVRQPRAFKALRLSELRTTDPTRGWTGSSLFPTNSLDIFNIGVFEKTTGAI